jgi:hypothetical protein
LERRVLPAARRFKELGMAGGEEIKRMEVVDREAGVDAELVNAASRSEPAFNLAETAFGVSGPQSA